MARIWEQDEIDDIRRYCEERLGPQVARMHVAVKDHGAWIGVLIETFDGRRHAVGAMPDGDDQQVGAQISDALERWIRAH